MKFIVTGDWHLRKDVPFCRAENEEEWLEAQRKQVLNIIKIANENKADIIHTGDIFNNSNVHPSVLALFFDCLDNLKGKFYYVIGNHDLQYHNINNLKDSSVYLLQKNPKCINLEFNPIQLNSYIIKGLNYNSEINFYDLKEENTIFITHSYVLPDFLKENFNFISYKDIQQNFVGIIAGHYHKYVGFYIENNKFLINTGCLNIQTSDMIKFIPQVFILNIENEINIKAIEIADTYFKPAEIYKITENLEFLGFIEKLKNAEENISNFDFEGMILQGLKTEEERKLFFEILEQAKKLKEVENE